HCGSLTLEQLRKSHSFRRTVSPIGRKCSSIGIKPPVSLIRPVSLVLQACVRVCLATPRERSHGANTRNRKTCRGTDYETRSRLASAIFRKRGCGLRPLHLHWTS